MGSPFRDLVTKTVVKWGIGAIITVVLAVAVAFTSRNVYSKDEVDAKIETVDVKVQYIRDDVQWLVRERGGTPAEEQAVAESDSN